MDEAAEITLHQAVNEAIAAEMRSDDRVITLGFEVSLRTGLASEFGPRRVLDTPIAELTVTGMGVGAARCGLRPVVDLMGSSFFFLALDQIANHAAVTHQLLRGSLPMALVLRGITGVGDTPAGAHHGRMAHSLLAGIPGLKVVMPSDAASGYALMRAAIRDPNPVIFLEHVRLFRQTGAVGRSEETATLGRVVRRRVGEDVTVVGIGPTVIEALTAAAELAECGISTEVLELCTVSPVDIEGIVDSVKKTGRLLVVDEAPEVGSTANYIVASVTALLGDSLQRPPLALTAPHTNVPFTTAAGPPMFLPTAGRIAETIRLWSAP